MCHSLHWFPSFFDCHMMTFADTTLLSHPYYSLNFPFLEPWASNPHPMCLYCNERTDPQNVVIFLPSVTTYHKGALQTHMTVCPCTFPHHCFWPNPCGCSQPSGWYQLQWISKPEDWTAPLDYGSTVSPLGVLQDKPTFSYLLLRTDC